MKDIMQQVSENNTKEVVFLFDVDKIILPYNYEIMKSYAQVFKDHKTFIENNLGFTIIKCKSNIFRMYFKLFKQFYTPIKPLYLCETMEHAIECIYNEEKRNELIKFDIKKIN